MQILDGRCIKHSEKEEAKQRFEGNIALKLLHQNIEGTNYHRLTQLDLSRRHLHDLSDSVTVTTTPAVT